ncbi:MAG TPA: anion permease [Bacteroidetes bacterium]|nr:MAG: inorganic phosphate transporter [Ignavibacteria bacterium GWA2_54_16]HCA80257.1 anion permease [Bacteroidota bacterium]
MALIIILVFVALAFDFLNGMNDAANSISTVVSTRVLTPRIAVAWAAFFNFVAAFGFGVAVAKTIGKGIVDPAVVTQGLIASALLGAIVWTHLCTRFGLPISVSHSLIGGLVGATIIKAGIGPLNIPGLLKVAAFIFLSPIVGLIAALLLMVLVTWCFRRSSPTKVKRVFKVGQLLSSAAYSLGHGTNDAQKTMGIISILLFSSQIDLPGWMYDKSEGFYVPVWVILSAHTAIGLGTLTGGWKVIRTMGMRLTHLQPVGGFCAETGGAFVLLGTAIFGIPVSTTHTIAGAIMGVGATRRISAVRWGIAGKIVIAWILTIPASAIVAAICYEFVGRWL